MRLEERQGFRDRLLYTIETTERSTENGLTVNIKNLGCLNSVRSVHVRNQFIDVQSKLNFRTTKLIVTRNAPTEMY